MYRKDYSQMMLNYLYQIPALFLLTGNKRHQYTTKKATRVRMTLISCGQNCLLTRQTDIWIFVAGPRIELGTS